MVNKLKELRPGVLTDPIRRPRFPTKNGKYRPYIEVAPGVYEGNPDWLKELEADAKASGLPMSTYGVMDFASWDYGREGQHLEEAIDYATAFAQGRTEFTIFTLAGPVGVGKTHLACAIGWDCLTQGYGLRFRCASGLVDELRSYYPDGKWIGNSIWRMEDQLNIFMNCSLLVIDDLGREKSTDWAAEKLDIIIDHRWLNNLLLVVTTNALGHELSPRIADRLRDTKRGKVVQIAAKSYRSQS